MMKRRTFLYNATLGTFGFFSSHLFRPSLNPFAASLDAFFQAIGARTQSWLSSDSFLNEACAKAIRPWEKTGYKPLQKDFYLCQKKYTAITILHLPHKELGTLDISALVFRRDDSLEKWKQTASLSGFQLEAIAKAAAAMQTNHTANQLVSLLLPSPRLAKRRFGGFITELGEVVVKANMGKDKIIKVEAAVYEGDEALWSAEYNSQYLQSL